MEQGSTPRRLLYIDNLRWCLISMVVVMHAAVTYSSFGSWYYREHPTLGLGTAISFAAYQSLQHAVSMGLLFGIAGYFAAGMVARKGVLGFVRERLYRLGWPLLLYMALIGPFTEFYLAGSWQSNPPRSFAEDWLHHLANGELWNGSGPLWFCLVLLIFSGGFAGARTFWPVALPSPQPPPKVRSVIAFAFAMSLVAFGVGLLVPTDRTILNVSIHDASQYPFMFVAGVAAWQGDWLRQISSRFGRLMLFGGLSVSVLWWLCIVFFGGAVEGSTAAYGGGWHWQAAAMDLWRSGTCVSLSLGLITFFRDFFDWQGPVTSFLSRSAFGVYVLHPPILVAITRAMQGISLTAGSKFLMASAIGVVASFLVVGLLARRVPVLQAVL
jgi:glucans biosynthesis protein C